MGFLSGLARAAGAVGAAVAAGSAVKKSSSSGGGSSSSSSMINNIAAQQLAARQAAIDKAKNEAINNYTQQIGKADSLYQPIRNQAAVMGAKNAQLLKEQMAQQGLFNSGDAVSSQLQNRNQTSTNINQASLQQQEYVNKLQNAIEQVRQNAGYESAQAVAQTEAQKLQSLLAQSNQDRQFNYQMNRDRIGDERYNKQFDYQKSRDTVNDQFRDKTFNYQSARDKLNDLFRDKDWNRQGTWHDADMKFREKDWNRQGQWHQDDVNYRNQQLALSRSRASSASANSYFSGSKNQKSNANTLMNEILNNVGNSKNKFDALLEYRNALKVPENEQEKAVNSRIKSAIGTKNLEEIRDVVGSALVNQSQRARGAANRANAFSR